MKNLSKVLALVLVVAMVFSMAVSAGAATSFKDDASVNYKEAVQLLSALDVLNGYDTDGDGEGDTFKPGANITRAEITVMLSYMVANEWSEFGLYSDINKLNSDYKALCTFADSKEHWAAGFIAYCAGNGYISGRSAEKFDPQGNVTIAEAAVMLLRVMGYDATVEEYGTTKNTVKGYNLQLDARNAGLLNGLENVDFFGYATREQVAQMFMNALDGYTVVYGNYSFTLGGNMIGSQNSSINVSIVKNTTATSTGKKLVDSCFWPVEKIDAYNEYGLLGHQWVSYDNKTHNGAYTALTDVYVDDTVLASFVGGTTYAAIASKLGLTSASSNLTARVYVNGYDVMLVEDTAVSSELVKNLAGVNGKLNEIYAKGVQNASLPDNCRLDVVRNYDTSVGATVYKLMYYYEYVATVSDPVQVNNAYHPYYGQYAYTFSVYNTYAYNETPATATVYSTSATAYSKDVKYLVVPNATGINSSASYPTINASNPFLSITVAKTVDSFTATRGYNATFANNNGYYISDGTTTYYVSKVAHAFFNEPAYNKALGLVLNTAGYVIGYTDATVSTVAGTGYLYVDALEYSATLNAYADLLSQLNYSWYAQGKALVYFPSETGNSTYSVIDLNVTVGTASSTINVGCANWTENGFTDKNISASAITLSKNVQTTATYEVNGTIGSYDANSNSSNVRVFTTLYDGWYSYVQYKDGTYALTPVRADEMATTAGIADVTLCRNGIQSTPDMTSSTVLYNYKMDLNTMTATKTLAATGYKTIAATGKTYKVAMTKHADDTLYALPYLGTVGVEVVTTATTNLVTSVSMFNTVGTAAKYAYTLFKGQDGYSTTYGEGFKFVVAGGVETLYMADTVTWSYEMGGTTHVNEKKATRAEALEQFNKILNTVSNGYTYAYALTVENGVITEVHAMPVTRVLNNNVQNDNTDDGVYYVDADGYIITGAGQATKNYTVANVWNFATGAATAATAGDTVYYVTGANDSIVAMWVVNPSYNYYPSNPWNGSWNWWN